MPKSAPSVSLRIALRDLEAQVRRMGMAHRAKKRGEQDQFVMAEVSALHHLADVKSWIEKLTEVT